MSTINCCGNRFVKTYLCLKCLSCTSSMLLLGVSGHGIKGKMGISNRELVVESWIRFNAGICRSERAPLISVTLSLHTHTMDQKVPRNMQLFSRGVSLISHEKIHKQTSMHASTHTQPNAWSPHRLTSQKATPFIRARAVERRLDWKSSVSSSFAKWISFLWFYCQKNESCYSYQN